MTKYEKYRPTTIEWIGDIPENWEMKNLGYIAKMVVPMRDKPKDLNGTIPWLRIEDFDGKFVSDSKSGQGVTKEIVDEMNLRVFPIGTVLCSCSCAMGKTAIVKKPLITNRSSTKLHFCSASGRTRKLHCLQRWERVRALCSSTMRPCCLAKAK